MEPKALIRSGRKNEPEKISLAGAISGEKVLQLLRRHYVLYVVMLVACFATVGVRHLFTPSYRSKATIILQAAINNPLQSLSTRLGGFSGFDVDGREADRYLSRLRVHAFYLRAAKAVKQDPDLSNLPVSAYVRAKGLTQVYREYTGKSSRTLVKELSDDALARRLAEMIAFSKDGIEAVSIHINASKPNLAFRLNNLVATAAVDSLIAFEEQDLSESDYYLKIQSKKTQDSIRETETEIAGFKRKKNLFSINTSFEHVTARSAEMNKELAEIDIQIAESKREIRELAKGVKTSEDGEGAGYKFGSRRKIASIDRELEELESRRASLKAMLSKLNKTYDENAEMQLAELKKKIDLESSLFQELKKHDFQMEMRRISARNKFHLLEPARLESVQLSESLVSKLLLALLVSIAVASLLAYGIEYAFPLAANRLDLEQAGLRYLGSVPDGEPKRSFIRNLIHRKNPIRKIAAAGVLEEISASFAQIAASITKRKESNPELREGWVITISSSEPGEGKTFTAKNLAMALAESRRRVLLIDGDLRAPSLSAGFKALKKEGLAEVVGSREIFGRARMAQVVPSLDFLPAGKSTANPTKLFTSKEFEEVVTGFKALYDFVVIDTPPSTVAGDSAVLMRISDLPVLVVGVGQVYLHVLHGSVASIEDFSKGYVYGVLNRVAYGKQYGYMRYGRTTRIHIVAPENPEAPAARQL